MAKELLFILFFAIDGLACYIFGYLVGHWTVEQEVENARKELDIDEEGDPFDELFK